MYILWYAVTEPELGEWPRQQEEVNMEDVLTTMARQFLPQMTRRGEVGGPPLLEAPDRRGILRLGDRGERRRARPRRRLPSLRVRPR